MDPFPGARRPIAEHGGESDSSPPHVQREIGEQVFLAAHHRAAAGLDQQVPGVDTDVDGNPFGVQQEARIHPGIAQREGLAIHPHRALVQRAHQVVGRVHQGEQIAPVQPAVEFGHRDERLQRAVARPGAQPGQGRIDPMGTLLDGGDRIGHAQSQVVVRVHPDGGARVECGAVGLNPVAHTGHGEPAAGVGDIHTARPGVFHDLRLGRQRFRIRQMRHHQKAGHVEAQVDCGADVLAGDVGLGAVGGDPHRRDAEIHRGAQVVDGADAGEQQGGQPGVVDDLRRGADPLGVAVGAGSVGQAAAGQTVTVGHFDGGDAGLVERPGDPAHIVEGERVPDRVHPVAQGHVLDVEAVLHNVTPAPETACSATRTAAAVMMSRLPA
ncbi:hypothetical protein EB73_24590 [Mycobacterium sp. SWH-M3]|nr:hypothetical protein EB73_24590 [Mycobacterium sp. SWH-M3]